MDILMGYQQHGESLADLLREIKEASQNIELADGRTNERISQIEKSVNDLLKLGRPGAERVDAYPGLECKDARELCILKHDLDVPKTDGNTPVYEPTRAEVDAALILPARRARGQALGGSATAARSSPGSCRAAAGSSVRAANGAAGICISPGSSAGSACACSSRHLHRTVPGIHRIRKLRQRIGADPRPFSPVLKRQRHHLRFHRIVAEIQALEQRLVEHLGTIVHDLERPARLRGLR